VADTEGPGRPIETREAPFSAASEAPDARPVQAARRVPHALSSPIRRAVVREPER